MKEAKVLHEMAKYIYPNINFIYLKKPFKEIWPLVDKHLENHPNSFLIPFGLHDSKYEDILYASLSERMSDYVYLIKRLWLTVGSGVLFGILYKILINTYFCLVQIGKDIDLDGYDMSRIKLYKSSYRLYDTINAKIPYSTTTSYDGKLWEFCQDFQNGDYIWNVAGIHDKK